MLHKKSIFSKYLLFFIIAGFLPLIFSAVILFRYYEANLMDNTMNSVSYMLNYLSDNITQVSEQLRNAVSDAKGSDEASELSQLLEKDGKQALSEIEQIRKAELARQIEAKLLNSNAYTKGAVFIDRNFQHIGETRITSIMNENYSFSYNTLIRNIFDGTFTDDFIPTHIADYYHDDTQVFTYVLRFTYTSDEKTEVIGVMLFDVYIDSVGMFFLNMNRDMMGILYLADSSGNCIYGINESWIGRKIYEFEKHKKANYSVMGGVNRLFRAEKIRNTTWTLVCGVNEDYLIRRIKSIKTTTMIIILFGMVACLLLALFGSNRLSKPIGKILRSMERARDGDLDAKAEMKRNDEIGRIAETYNDMLSQMKENIQRVYLMQIKQREAELSALKAQIQPHFLYNTLEVIRMSAMANNDNDAAEMIASLAEQFRYILENSSDETTLDEEIRIIKEYFKIINVRYGGTIKLELSISDEARRIEIPKLSIQTLVENSVMHGLRECGGKVRINGLSEDNKLTIEIIDTGVGMSEQRLIEVQNALLSENGKISRSKLSSGLGIKNSYDRLKMVYGDKISFVVKSIPKIGTSVRITIKGGEDIV